MRALLRAVLVAASRDLFTVPVNNGFLASPVSVEPMSAAYTPVAGPYTEYRIAQSQVQPSNMNDFVTGASVVAMFAVIGYSIGRVQTNQPRGVASKPKQFHRAPAPVATAPKVDVSTMIGTYQWKDATGNKVFDPLNLASKYDVNWLREAELKHGRVTMLATVGFLANDLGLKFPYERFQGVSSVDAHDKMVETGDMWTLLFVVGTCELIHASKIVPRLDGDWEGWEPGNYGIDPMGWASDGTREAELKHSRLAMIAFGGLVTQSALGYPVTSLFG